VRGLADQRDCAMALRRVRRAAVHQRAHEFGAGARLAGAAPAEQQPAAPRPAMVGGGGRLLVRMGERDEVTIEPQPRADLHLRQHRLEQIGLRRKL
jgi:hypothetical protein